MTSYARQKRYRDKKHADGHCMTCDLYTPINPKTGKPFWNCKRCRLRSAERYRKTGKQGHGQRALEALTVAALFVSSRGPYAGLPDVDLWDERRDARLYGGPHPVVAHPPCSRWCRLAGLVEARWGHKKGDDGGCFESALASVRTWGGVLEHPAYTDAFTAYGLPIPSVGGWQRTLCGGWVAHVEQGRYGHPAKKATWLYAHGVERLPSLDWRTIEDRASSALVSWCGNHTSKFEKRPRVGKAVASRTPEAFRDLLLLIARSVGTVTEQSA